MTRGTGMWLGLCVAFGLITLLNVAIPVPSGSPRQWLLIIGGGALGYGVFAIITEVFTWMAAMRDRQP